MSLFFSSAGELETVLVSVPKRRCSQRGRARSHWLKSGPYTLKILSSRSPQDCSNTPPQAATEPTFAMPEIPCLSHHHLICFHLTNLDAQPWRPAKDVTEPKRGPKSAPPPVSQPPRHKNQGRRGVRVSPPTAGGEGPEQSPLWTFHEPGKHAEGSHNLTLCYNRSSYAQTTIFCSPSGTVYRTWGRLFHRFRFRYLTLTKRKKRHLTRPLPPSTHHRVAQPGPTTQRTQSRASTAVRPTAHTTLQPTAMPPHGGGMWFSTP